MAKKLILHIGTEKTGTTSIQDFLYLNRVELEKNGVFFPTSPCGSPKFPNHRKLATACFREGRVDDSFDSLNLTKESFSKWRDIITRSVIEELGSNNSPLHVLSSEHFSSRLTTEEEIRTLYDLLVPLYDEILVVVYIRRQDEYVMSSYSTYLKAGGTKFEIMSTLENHTDLNLYDLCNKWEDVFGFSSLDVRVFERSSLINSNVVDDFCNVLGVELEKFELPKRESNPSLNSKAQEYLRLLNLSGLDSSKRSKVVEFLEMEYAGKPRLPRAEFVKEWYGKNFISSNDELFKKYFDGDIKFSESFDAYPEDWSQETGGRDEYFSMSVGLINFLTESKPKPTKI